MAIKDQFKKVKNMNLGNINLNNLTSGVPLVKDNFTKEIEAKMQARDQVYNYIAMDVVDLYKEGMLNIPQLDIHFDKLAELENEIEELETEKQKMELQTKGQTTCSCGASITVNDRFCPVCGKTVDSGYITCVCGNKVKSEQKFCPVCGNSIHDMNSSMMPMGVPQPGMMMQNGIQQPGMMQQSIPQPGMMMQSGLSQPGMMMQSGLSQPGMMQQPIPQMMPIRASELRMKECICGAKVPEGQTMCMECGRKI